MTDFIDPGIERDLLDKWGGRMAKNLIAHAAQQGVDLRPLLDSGYNWFEWLGTAWNDEGVTRDLVFWSLSHSYAEYFAKMDDQPEIYQARRWQVAQHAIKLIGRELYPANDIRWEEVFYDKASEFIERSWPCVLGVNNELMTIYFVNWCCFGSDGWSSVVIAINVEQLTEFDWLEWAGMRMNLEQKQAYTMNHLLEDLVRDGQGAYMWHGPARSMRVIAITEARKQAQSIAANFHHEIYGQQLYDHGTRKDDLRATGGEHTWKELPEFRQRFGGDTNAIDRHSVRVYSYGRQRYTLDRINSISPPCFTLYYQDRLQRVFTPVVLIEGQAIWGDGLSWEKAEKIAERAAHDRTFARFS